MDRFYPEPAVLKLCQIPQRAAGFMRADEAREGRRQSDGGGQRRGNPRRRDFPYF